MPCHWKDIKVSCYNILHSSFPCLHSPPDRAAVCRTAKASRWREVCDSSCLRASMNAWMLETSSHQLGVPSFFPFLWTDLVWILLFWSVLRVSPPGAPGGLTSSWRRDWESVSTGCRAKNYTLNSDESDVRKSILGFTSCSELKIDLVKSVSLQTLLFLTTSRHHNSNSLIVSSQTRYFFLSFSFPNSGSSELAERIQTQLPAMELGCSVGENGLKQSAWLQLAFLSREVG